MKNIRFYEAEKYKTPEYGKVEDMIYKTREEKAEDEESYALRQCRDAALAEKLRKLDGWTPGSGDFFEDFLIITYEGKKYYRETENAGTEEDIIYEDDEDDTEEEEMIYVTSVVFEPEPDLDENEPEDPFVSQYPLEDLLDEFNIYCYDSYEEENTSDKKNSYLEFASEDIEDIRKVLSIIGKHVYNKADGDYVRLIIE